MRKIKAIFEILFKDNLNYRAQAVVWIMTTVIPTMTTAAVWLASFGGAASLGTFNREQLLVYFLGSLVLSNLIVSSISFDMGQEIKDGKASFYLVRPLSYPMYQFLANFAWRIFRSIIFIPFFILIIVLAYSHVSTVGLNLGWSFWGLVILAHLTSFLINFIIGSFAFYFENISSVGQILFLLNYLFSGQLAPISLMPHTLRVIAELLPFRFVMSFPLEVMTGRAQDIGHTAMVGVIWLIGLFIFGQVFFQFGLRRYSAVGQ